MKGKAGFQLGRIRCVTYWVDERKVWVAELHSNGRLPDVRYPWRMTRLQSSIESDNHSTLLVQAIEEAERLDQLSDVIIRQSYEWRQLGGEMMT